MGLEGIKNRKYLVIPLLKMVVINLVFMIVFSIKDGFYIMWSAYKFVFVFLTLTYKLPLLILYVNYKRSLYSCIEKIIINRHEGSLTLCHNNVYDKYSFEEIKEVVMICSPNLYNNRLCIFFWDEYFYTIFKFKDGKEYNIPCIIIDEFNFLPDEKVKKKLKLFALMPAPKKTTK